MSSRLSWMPFVQPKMKDLSTDIKFKLHKKYGSPVCVTLTENDVPFLEGLAACDVDDAQKLIDAIEKHGKINVVESYD